MGSLWSFLFPFAKEPTVGDHVQRHHVVGVVISTNVWSSEYPKQSCLSVHVPGCGRYCWPSNECAVTKEGFRSSLGTRIRPGSRVRQKHHSRPVGTVRRFKSKMAGTGKRRKFVPIVVVEVDNNGRIEFREWRRREVVIC